MTERVEKLLKLFKSKEYRKQRRHAEVKDYGQIKSAKQMIDCFEEFVSEETPVLIEGDRMGFYHSTDRKLPGYAGNVTPDYGKVMACGFDKILEDIEYSMKNTDDADKTEYGRQMKRAIEIVLDVSDKHRELAKKAGNHELYNALLKVPHKGAESFYEACVFMKIIIFFLRLEFMCHITLGRFDRYMYPYYLADRERGVGKEELFELTEEFFISLNFDSDLYSGIQTGDNGQSMVLGGFDADGEDMFNELSKMCMDASLELCVIDPKINLRVGKNTPFERYEYATHLTKAGLGFPQYCNDDVVVEGLVKLGYDRADAFDYSVAACWEFIIPGKGADAPNIETMDFPKLVNDVIHESLQDCGSFDELLEKTKAKIKKCCEEKAARLAGCQFTPSPLLSVFFDGCTENLTDMWSGGTKYHNFGCHGAGIANAADALAAVKKTVFDDGSVTKAALLHALDNDFDGNAELRNLLRACPKMGNNDDYADSIACFIMSAFSESMNNRDNGCGGIWRAGTGSAQEYIFRGNKCPATADGRKAYTPYASSFSPSLDVKTAGLLSVIQSFTKYDLKNIITGGPLTIEIHDTVLRNDDGIKKTAMLVREYIHLGGHQLQLNSVNRERLLDAQKHPENYKDLIVRVWGWSGYFNELDKKFQDHIIRRCEYNM